MLSIVPSVVFLGLVAIVAMRLAQQRSSPIEAAGARNAASKVLGIAIAAQSAHFAEEWLTGFHVRFPALFGLGPVPLSLFATFNLVWITIWIVSIPFLRLGRRLAFFAARFMAIAGTLNGVAHPTMAIAYGGYFPGLITSPVIGLAGVILWQRLQNATSVPIRGT